MPPHHVLFVEDDRDLQRMLGHSFKNAGFRFASALDGETALRLVRETAFDLILLDLGLPDVHGTEVCRKLKQSPETAAIPVVMTTAQGGEIDRVIGFELGAADYVVKPFSVRELILRVRAILRRTRGAVEAQERFTFGRLAVDRAAHRAWVEGEEIVLTATELRLVLALYDHRGRVLGRDLLVDDVWGVGADMAARNVDTHVKRIREKLGPAGEYVETVRGVGYRFRAEPATSSRGAARAPRSR
jgi:two-component system, OmpR family, phosphate regulon response regulator PhoB